MPALLSSELPRPDSDPVRVLLLGEHLIAFRDTNGPGRPDRRTTARIAAPRCSSAATKRPACAASTTAGSSTSTATASTCPTSRPSPTSSPRSRRRPTRPRNAAGLVWVYMGGRETPPPLPNFEAVLSPTAQALAAQQECSWLQTLEGDIDTSHFGFLHRGSISVENSRRGRVDRTTGRSRSAHPATKSWMWRRASCTAHTAMRNQASTIGGRRCSFSRSSR